MPKKGDDFEQLTADVSLDHHGFPATYTDLVLTTDLNIILTENVESFDYAGQMMEPITTITCSSLFKINIDGEFLYRGDTYKVDGKPLGFTRSIQTLSVIKQ